MQGPDGIEFDVGGRQVRPDGGYSNAAYDHTGRVIAEVPSVNYGLFHDWEDPEQGQGESFLRKATEIKNIWIPYGE